jgi:hypothetical protein
MLLIIIVLGALLGACGAEQPTGKTTNTASGVVTVGTPTAGLTTCVSCHPVTTTDWMLTKHANVEPLGNLYSAGNPTLGQIAGCATNCHDSTGDGAGNSFTAGFTGNVARPVVGCESCHSGGQMHTDGGGSGPIGFATTTAMVIGTTSTMQVSAQFRTCTGCHELLDPADPVNTEATATHSTFAPTGNAYVITDTHFATPGDFSGIYNGSTGLNIRNVTGYSMNYASETVCTDCHNPHRSADINREWAQSAHADKYAGFYGLPATEDPLGYFSSAWAHYDWSSRATCQRCHTTTGFAAYAGALQAGNRSLAEGISSGTVQALAAATTPSFKPEMLKCNGCHVDNKGGLRNPGAITANYDYISSGRTYAKASFAYPDVKSSNVCMACHTARESGETIRGLNDSGLLSSGTITFFNFGSNGFINSHYLTAGGTVFTATGFEFDGRSYENPSTYRHINIGSSAEPNTGPNGPCLGCHMSRPGNVGNHLFLPVTRSTSTFTPGRIDSVSSQVCIQCHTASGAGGLEELINERKEEYHESIEAVLYALDKRGIYFRAASPYFFALRSKSTSSIKVNVVNGSPTVTGVVTSWTATNVMGIETSLAPDHFKVNGDGTYYRIAAVVDATTLILENAYEGSDANNADYTIIQTSTSSLRSGSSVTTAAANVVNGSSTVTITGPLYSSGSVTICPTTCSSSSPDWFKVASDADLPIYYRITAVSDNGINTSTITLERPYAGASNAAANFSVLKSGTSGLRDWRTKAGSGIVPAIASDTDTSGRTTARYNMGAAFNFNLLEHDPGAYVHNRTYTKRLFYDSLDWADDNLMNFSVGATLNSINGTVYLWKTGAMKYLLPNGVIGIAAERP